MFLILMRVVDVGLLCPRNGNDGKKTALACRGSVKRSAQFQTKRYKKSKGAKTRLHDNEV